VLARLVVKLLETATVIPGNVIAFTFTEKAAAELKERIFARCRESVGNVIGLADMFVGTIHAFCLELLKTEVPDYLKFEVVNEVQQSLLVDRHSTEAGLTTTKDLAGRNLRRYRDTGIYVSVLSILRETLRDDSKLKGASVLDGLARYEALLQSKRYFDYSAIMGRAVGELFADKALQKRLSERVKYLIVDEYQDVNPIQESVIRMFAGLGASICVVGDDDQTIYQWRGTDVQNIIEFENNYSNFGQVTPVRLQENFRSSKGIVEVASDFIKQNSERLKKEMRPTGAQRFEQGDILALKFDCPAEEAKFIVQTIKALRGVGFKEEEGRRGLSYSDCAILLRSVKRNGGPILEALRMAGIPFVVEGMNNLFETPEAEAARQLFLFMSGNIDEKELRAAWGAANLGVAKKTLKSAIAAATKTRSEIETAEEGRFHVYSIQRLFLSFLSDLDLREESVPDDRGEIVFYNFGKFSQLISDFESIHYYSAPKRKYESFSGFLVHRAEEAYPEGWQDKSYTNPDAVRVLTIHQAKGMQWPVVFIPALLRNRFPSPRMGGRSVWHVIPPGSIHGQERFLGTIDDERRLFYVAVTRAQKFLFMTWAPIEGSNNRYVRPSEFWEYVLRFKSVKRRLVSFDKRKRLKPRPKANVSRVTFSFSDLKYFFECPYQFKLRILYGFNMPIHEALGYGKSLHDALAEVHKKALWGQRPTEQQAKTLVKRHLHVPYAYPSLEEALRKSAERVIRNYIHDNQDIFDKIEFSEKAVEISLGDGVTVTGRIDLVRRLDTNETSIVDLKSSDRAQPEDVTETQLHVYALGYQELTGRNADYVEVYELDERKRKPRAVDDEFIDTVKEHIMEASECLRNGKFVQKAKKSVCLKCDYFKMCPAKAQFGGKSKGKK